MDLSYSQRASTSRIVATVVAAALAGGLGGGAVGFLLSEDSEQPRPGATAAGSTVSVSPSTAPARELSASKIYDRVAPGVVVITDTRTRIVPPTLFTPRQKLRVASLGSGFVVDERGDIVTNEHVVHGSMEIRVGFSNGATYPATLVGSDPSTDIAVLRVSAPAPRLHPLSFGNSDEVHVGDPAYAIGNPFGLERTMTAGIVSATGRDIQAPNDLTIPGAIQTDAPINHGNSGGPLLDRFGRVIGVSAQIEGGTVDANVGIGFAVPSNTAHAVADQLIATGHAEHAWLGIRIQTVDSSLGKVVGLPRHGVAVIDVAAGSPAAKAGLRPSPKRVRVSGSSVSGGGDVIVGLDDMRISYASTLSTALARHEPGDTVTLDVIRDGAERTVTVTLGNAPG